MDEKRIAPARKTTNLSPLVITSVYAVVGWTYVLLSDRLLVSLVKDPGVLTSVQTFKGVVFIFVTAVMLYLLIRRLAGQLQRLLSRATESEQKYRDLVNLLPEPIFETDIYGVLTYANGKFLTSFELSSADVSKGVNIFDHIGSSGGAITSPNFPSASAIGFLGVEIQYAVGIN